MTAPGHAGNTDHRGVPGPQLCRNNPPISRRAPHNCRPGNPRGRTSRCTSPRHEGGRRRAIGVVAVHQSSLSRPRRWCDAGPPGPTRRTRRPALQEVVIETAPGHAEDTPHRGVPEPPLRLRGYGPHRGVPSLGFFFALALKAHSRSEKLQGGQPPRRDDPLNLSTPRGRPPARHRRGRSPSIISLTTTPMVRRWDAGCNPADQKAGAPGSQDRCGLADVEIHPSLSARVCPVTVRVLKGSAAGHECPAYSSE